MKTYSLILFVIFYYIYRYISIEIKPEIKKNVSKFSYRINYKYEGMLMHSFDRFYVVTKFILPSIQDFNLSKLDYDNACAHLEAKKNSHDAETK